MKKLSKYPSIGPFIEAQPYEVAIDTTNQLQSIIS